MKEYRLAAWPDLRPPYHGMAYHRMISDMSHRHVTLAQLVDKSGLRRHQVRQFLEMLDGRGLLVERDRSAPDSVFGSLRPLGGWLRRALTTSHERR
jgi:hypothetical protein